MSLFGGPEQRMQMTESVEMTARSLAAYGERYPDREFDEWRPDGSIQRSLFAGGPPS